METTDFIFDKLTEWDLSEYIQTFEEKGVDKETFLSLCDSSRLNEFIPKIGPRAKFKRRLREYLQREKHCFVREKLTEWDLSELIETFENHGIDRESFLSLEESSSMNTLIPKIGPRVKFRKRLRDYCQVTDSREAGGDGEGETRGERGREAGADEGREPGGGRGEGEAEKETGNSQDPSLFPPHLESTSGSDRDVDRDMVTDSREAGGDGEGEARGERGREAGADEGREPGGGRGEGEAEKETGNSQDPSLFPPHLESTSGSDRDVDRDMNEEPIYPDAPVSQRQGLLAAILFILRHHLTSAVQTGFIALLNFLIPNLLVESQHLSHNIHAEFYCDGCQNYFGKNPTCCFHCNTICKKTSSFRSGNFFLFSPLKDLLKVILENHGTELLPKTVNKPGHDIKDVMDGMMYQNLLKQGILGVDDLTLTWNCDGVPIYEPRFSIWPLQFTINELPYKQRSENVVVAGLWFGQDRPNMDVLLKRFVDECCDLAHNPFEWRDSSGKVHSSKVFSLICSSDAVARPLLRNCKQFNGEHGCDWCLHPGTMVKKGSGFTRSYPYDEMKQNARSNAMFEENACEAENKASPVMGVKGRSLLSSLPLFDMVLGFVPEYVHSVLLGVSKQLMSLWLDPVNSIKDWYVGEKTEQMDSYLRRLKTPTEISQPLQSVKCWDSWKASEWWAFLLFYAIGVLPGILHPRYLTHYLYLSFSIHILLQESVSEYDLHLAREYLKGFVKGMETFYGEENMSFNCHQLIHLVDSVQHWGPLWATSAFTFERNNKNLRCLLTNIDYNPEHIYQRFLFWQHIPNHLNALTFNPHLEFGELLTKFLPENDKERSYKPLGNSHHLEITGSIKLAIEELLNRPVFVKRAEAFESFKIGNTVYSSENLNESHRADSAVKLRNGFSGEIHLMLLLKERCTCASNCSCKAVPIIVAHMYDIQPEERFKYITPDDASKMIFVRVERTEQPKAFYLDDVRCKCMNVDGWLVPLPNSYERY